MEAIKKWHQAEDRWLAAQHQWECEKEAHDMQMFHLCLRYQRASATGMVPFNNLNAFGGAAGSDVANEEGLFLEPFQHR